MDKSLEPLEERLTLQFPEPLTFPRVERLFTHIARAFHGKVNYQLKTFKKVGTTFEEVPIETFYPKYQKTGISGDVQVYYIAPFSMFADTNGFYMEMTFDYAIKVECPSPGWPQEYYNYVDKIKEMANNYLAQLEMFPEY